MQVPRWRLALAVFPVLVAGCLGFGSQEASACGPKKHVERYEDNPPETYDHSFVHGEDRIFLWFLEVENICPHRHVGLQFQSETQETTFVPGEYCNNMAPRTEGAVDWGIIFEEYAPEKGPGTYDEAIEIGLLQAFPDGPGSLQASISIAVRDLGTEDETDECLEYAARSVGIIVDYYEAKPARA